MSVTIAVDLREIYNMLCEECRKKLIRYLKEKITEEFIRRQLEGG